MKTKNILTGAQAYCPPSIRIMELYPEGFLCASNSSADDLKLGDELLDYEQIF
jgi:hypothetical protein